MKTLKLTETNWIAEIDHKFGCVDVVTVDEPFVRICTIDPVLPDLERNKIALLIANAPELLIRVKEIIETYEQTGVVSLLKMMSLKEVFTKAGGTK